MEGGENKIDFSLVCLSFSLTHSPFALTLDGYSIVVFAVQQTNRFERERVTESGKKRLACNTKPSCEQCT